MSRSRPGRPPLHVLLTQAVFIVPSLVMWFASRLGYTRSVITAMARPFNSPRLKRRAFKGYQPSARDVLVCTYSKSGTNWMMQIAYQVAQRGRGEYEHIHHVVPWPEAPMPGIVPLSSARDEVQVIKTHLESSFVPYSPDAKYIVIVRDPKEVCVSSYFFSSGMFSQATMVPVEVWVEMFLSDNFQYGSWAEHIASFWPWRERANVMLVTFDQMKQDLEGMVRQVAAFMGVELTEAEFALVVQKSTFQYMKQIDRKFTPQMPFPLNRLQRMVMMRKGERGKSSDLLSPQQQAQIDQHMKAELRRLGCDFPYDELFDTRYG